MGAMNAEAARAIAKRQSRFEEVAALYCEGWTQAAIGKRFGVSQATISQDLEDIRKLWLASAVRKFDEAKAAELAKLDHLEAKAWQSFELSQGTVSKRLKKDTGKRSKNGKPIIEKSTVEHEECGDPRYMGIVLDCINKRCEILGLNAPKKIDTNNNILLPGSGALPTREELKELARKRIAELMGPKVIDAIATRVPDKPESSGE